MVGITPVLVMPLEKMSKAMRMWPLVTRQAKIFRHLEQTQWAIAQQPVKMILLPLVQVPSLRVINPFLLGIKTMYQVIFLVHLVTPPSLSAVSLILLVTIT